MNKKIPYAKVIGSGVANCFRAHPPLFFGLIAVSVMLCAVEVGEIFAMLSLFDAAADYINGIILFNEVVYAALPLAVLLAAGPFVYILEYLGQGYFWRRGSGYLMARYHERIQKIPLLDFEKAETFDRMKKASSGSEDAPSASRSVIQFLFHFIPYLVFTSVFLISVSPALLITLFIIFASVVVAQFLRAGYILRFENENAGLRRQTEYLESCVAGREYIKETRVFGATAYFFGLFIDSLKRLNKAVIATERKISRVELLLRIVNVLGYVGILFLMIYYCLNGRVSAGAFASVFYSIERISGVLRDMVELFGETLKEMSTASFTYEFLNDDKNENAIKNYVPFDKKSDIRLENVSFGYLENKNVLNGIDLIVKRGETLAIVGENGAGKTTLSKIISGLYNPASGRVLYGEKDICDYRDKLRFHGISAVFQDFMKYKLTAKENIMISGVGSKRDVLYAAAEAGVSFDKLSQGYDTVLSREFGGTELSGGEWQRVAIARGLYRDHEIIILDEPTAAIDPIEESNIFRMFKESAKDKTAILITHRLGSAKIADRILLLDNGKIIELGSHDELIALNGKYAQMYREQAGWYER